MIDLAQKQQFYPESVPISPNSNILAMTDGHVTLFDSGVLLEYLADKHLAFRNDPCRYQILTWHYWQVGGLGPMGGQNHFFRTFALEPNPFATDRCTEEYKRLYSVLDWHLLTHEFVGSGGYHIAGMAIYPWMGTTSYTARD